LSVVVFSKLGSTTGVSVAGTGSDTGAAAGLGEGFLAIAFPAGRVAFLGLGADFFAAFFFGAAFFTVLLAAFLAGLFTAFLAGLFVAFFFGEDFFRAAVFPAFLRAGFLATFLFGAAFFFAFFFAAIKLEF